MSFVSIIATIFYLVLNLFIIMMWARLVLDLARTFARQWRPRGVLLILAEIVFTVTDPPVKLVRRIVPPLRVGGIALDFAWSIVLLACLLLVSIIAGFIN
ncbi:MAG: YggT family protein [Salinibacterium sp.]|nr:YggT family protein [Salinibacterium sp.]